MDIIYLNTVPRDISRAKKCKDIYNSIHKLREQLSTAQSIERAQLIERFSKLILNYDDACRK